MHIHKALFLPVKHCVCKSKALGRMVVELAQIQAGETSADFILEDGDFVFVPTFRNTESIMGEVQVAITYLLDDKIDVDGYINKAGGIKKQADEERVFVVRADGSVYKPNSGYWFDNDNESLNRAILLWYHLILIIVMR